MFRGVPVPSKALKRVFITSIERQKGTIFIKFASIVYPTGLYKRLVCPIVICFIAFVIILFHFLDLTSSYVHLYKHSTYFYICL